MTEEIVATPGWVEDRLDGLLAPAPASGAVQAARGAYLDCLGNRKAPAAPSDMLGAETEPCHQALLRALSDAGVHVPGLDTALEALEAEFAEDS